MLFAQYQVATEEVRKLQQSFFREDMPVVMNVRPASIDLARRTAAAQSHKRSVCSLLQGLQKVEEERVESAVASLVQYSAIQHTAIPTTRESCLNLVTFAQTINKKDDIRAFVVNHLERSRTSNKSSDKKASAAIAAGTDADPVFYPPRLPKFKPFALRCIHLK